LLIPPLVHPTYVGIRDHAKGWAIMGGALGLGGGVVLGKLFLPRCPSSETFCETMRDIKVAGCGVAGAVLVGVPTGWLCIKEWDLAEEGIFVGIMVGMLGGA